jgi:hypothetical protein
MKTKAKPTLARLISRAGNIPESLIRATVRQCGGWENFTGRAPDVVNHGADGGFSGFIYYKETVAFARRNRAAIVKLCEDMAEGIGEPGPIALVRGFRCLSDSIEAEVAASLYGRGDGDTQVSNALAWFALEEVSRAFVDMQED